MVRAPYHNHDAGRARASGKTKPYMIVADPYEMVEGAEETFFCIVIVRE